MSWGDISPELREIIEASCTERQVEALKLQAAGMSQRGIARALNQDPASARGLLNRAYRRIRAELERRNGSPA